MYATFCLIHSLVVFNEHDEFCDILAGVLHVHLLVDLARDGILGATFPTIFNDARTKGRPGRCKLIIISNECQDCCSSTYNMNGFHFLGPFFLVGMDFDGGVASQLFRK